MTRPYRDLESGDKRTNLSESCSNFARKAKCPALFFGSQAAAAGAGVGGYYAAGENLVAAFLGAGFPEMAFVALYACYWLHQCMRCADDTMRVAVPLADAAINAR